ncbi:unnamed protein product [Urochloa humidicola]
MVAAAAVDMPVAEGTDAVPDTGEVANAIAAATGEEGNPVRKRAVELGKKVMAAVAEDGCSHGDLEDLVRMLSKVD